MTDFIDDLNFLGKLYNSGRGFVPEINTNEKLIRISDEDETTYDYLECVDKSKRTALTKHIILYQNV